MKTFIRLLLLVLLALGSTSAQAAVAFDAAKQYYIKNYSTGLYLGLQTGHKEDHRINATPLYNEPVPFTITGSGSSFVLRSGDLYMGLSTSIPAWNTGSFETEQPVWTIIETETPNQYRIKSPKGWLKFDGNNEYAYTNGQENVQSLWEIAEYFEDSGTIPDFQLPTTGSSSNVTYFLCHEKSGLYVTFGDVNANATLTENGTPLTITENNGGFTIKSAAENKYLGATSWNAVVSRSAITWTAVKQSDGCYVLSQTSSNFSGQLGCDDLDNDQKLYCNKSLGMHFRLVRSSAPVAQLTNGRYYRLRNHFQPDRYITAYDDALYAYTSSYNVYDQVWYATESGSNWTLRNALTNSSVRATKKDGAYELGAIGSLLHITQSGTDEAGKAYFMIAPLATPTGYFNNSKSAQQYKIVSWAPEDDDSSWWYAEEFVITDEDIQRINTLRAEQAERDDIIAHIDEYSAALDGLFADKAYTQLKAPYSTLSDALLEQRLTAQNLPTVLKTMALNVKNDRWDANTARSSYIKRFRIADYGAYSDPDEWKKITNVGPFAVLTNPTGITVSKYQLLYVMVGAEPVDASAKIQLGIARDTDHNPSQTFDLHAGLNIVECVSEGEAFVLYTCTDTERQLADYPPITVHIEGGEATGYWDLSRGMTNADWDWLCGNMFTAPFLHVKGRSTVLNVLTDNVRGAANPEGIMKIWDFVFETEERLVGNDGQWDGRYRPVINPRHSYGGNPNWGGSRGTNHPSISSGYLFNFEKMVNDVGHLWEIYHEEAHAHQYPINMAATTESSNNGYAHMTNYEFGSYNSRNKGVETLITFKNNGWGWVDILRGGEGCSRAEGFPYYDDALWLQSHLFYQLYLYFHVQGHMPDFWPRVADWMRTHGGISYGWSAEAPGYYYNDYLKFAEACTEVSQTDLYEFFDTWGFFAYCDEVKVGNDFVNENAQYFKDNDRPDLGVRFVGDYGKYYLRMPIRGDADDEALLAALTAKMRAMPKKAPGIMFIDDHIAPQVVSDTCFIARADIYPSRIGTPLKDYGVTSGTSGDFGMFTDFDGVNRTAKVDFKVSGSNVNITGSGLLGIKVYSPDGRLAYIANTKTFTPSATILQGIQNGTYRVVVVCGDDTELPLLSSDIYDYNGDGEITIDDVALLISYLPHTTHYAPARVGEVSNKVLKK